MLLTFCSGIDDRLRELISVPDISEYMNTSSLGIQNLFLPSIWTLSRLVAVRQVQSNGHIIMYHFVRYLRVLQACIFVDKYLMLQSNGCMTAEKVIVTIANYSIAIRSGYVQ